ncbi:MAG: hypothetical protein KAJ73_05540 [Zetaproteobacteria bacterium]|nr:hypothetical protein [Zetaproteobacteria bacterium]
MDAVYFADGTIAEAQALELTEVPDFNKAEWLVYKNNPQLSPMVISDPGKSASAVNAISDVVFHGLVDLDQSEPGLHIYTSADLPENRLMNTDILSYVGVISVAYQGDEAVAPSIKFAPFGWAGLDLVGPAFIPCKLRGKRTEEEKKQGKKPVPILTAYKHTVEDAILAGRPVVVRIGFYNRNDNGNSFIAGYIEQWTNENKAEALEARNNAIEDRQTQVNVINPLVRDAKKANGNGVQVVADAATGELEPTPEPEPIMVAVHGKSNRKNIMDIPAGDYATSLLGRITGLSLIEWDPTKPELLDVWAGVVENQMAIVLD